MFAEAVQGAVSRRRADRGLAFRGGQPGIRAHHEAVPAPNPVPVIGVGIGTTGATGLSSVLPGDRAQDPAGRERSRGASSEAGRITPAPKRATTASAAASASFHPDSGGSSKLS